MTGSAVLDTNAVLDWLVFHDPSMGALGGDIEASKVLWLACPRMREELRRTLTYAALAPWAIDGERVLASFDRYAELRPEPTPSVLPVWRCSDPDDQIFIDLALSQGARWLISRDKAVLKLRRRAAAVGLHIVRPAQWELAVI